MGVRAVFLVGFMASGKSSVGQELARRLDWDFVDLDARIESRERQTISEIFRDRGEAAFRLAETSALRDLTESLGRDTVERNSFVRNAVVALAVEPSRNRRTGSCCGPGPRYSWTLRSTNSGGAVWRTRRYGLCETIPRSSPVSITTGCHFTVKQP